MNAAIAWLDSHDADAPERLRARMRELVAALPEDPDVWRTLTAAAGDALSAVMPHADKRAAALDLLAADALLTHAAEAAAEEGAEALAAVAEIFNARADALSSE